MKPSERNIKRSIKELRKIIDGDGHDQITTRMAYFAENTLRWVLEDTKGWDRPEVDLIQEADLLRKTLGFPEDGS